MFLISTLFTNLKGPKEHIQARSAMRVDFWKKWRKPFLKKSCLAIRLKKSRKCALSPPPPASAPHSSLATERQEYLNRNLYSKHIYWNIKLNGKPNDLPLFFRPFTCLLSVLASLRDQEQGGLCLGQDERQAVLPECPGRHISSCPAELYFKGKVELPFWVRINIINIYQKSQNLYFYAFRIF